MAGCPKRKMAQDIAINQSQVRVVFLGSKNVMQCTKNDCLNYVEAILSKNAALSLKKEHNAIK